MGAADVQYGTPGKPFVFLNTPFDEHQGEFSPDGRWVAYQSNESGRYEIYVRPFPNPRGSGRSRRRAASILWRPDGKELYYLAPAGTIMAAPIAVTGRRSNPAHRSCCFRHASRGGMDPRTDNNTTSLPTAVS